MVRRHRGNLLKYEEIDWPFVYELENPVTIRRSKSGDQEIAELEFREPTLGDVGEMKLGEAFPLSRVCTVGARLTGKPAVVLRKLTGNDATMLCTVVFGFFAKCQAGIGED